MTISGSGISYTISLAQPINKADRVTITIGNAIIATFTRELDVVPGDFNDEAWSTARTWSGCATNGWGRWRDWHDLRRFERDGVVNITDYNDVLAFLGTSLPPVAPSGLLVNGDFSLGNTGFTSQYVYSTNLEPKGNYVVGANPHDFHPGGASSATIPRGRD